MKTIGFPLSLLLSGLICALLVLSAGELLSSEERGGGQVPAICASFFVGLRHPGNTRVHLANTGRDDITARLEHIDESGKRLGTGGYGLGPYATRDVDLGRLPPELGIKVSSTSPDLRVSAEVVFNNGSESEPYRAGLCA